MLIARFVNAKCMKKYLLLFLLPLLFSCTTNYYYAIANEDIPLYASKDETGDATVLISKGEPMFVTGGTKKYRRVKYAHYSGWVANPIYTLASDPNVSSSSSTSSSSMCVGNGFEELEPRRWCEPGRLGV